MQNVIIYIFQYIVALLSLSISSEGQTEQELTRWKDDNNDDIYVCVFLLTLNELFYNGISETCQLFTSKQSMRSLLINTGYEY